VTHSIFNYFLRTVILSSWIYCKQYSFFFFSPGLVEPKKPKQSWPPSILKQEMAKIVITLRFHLSNKNDVRRTW